MSRKPLLEQPTVGSRGGIIGRPRKLAPTYKPWPIREEPPENVQEFIRQRAASGESLVLIAHGLGTTAEVLRRWMSEDRNLKWAYQVGLAQDEAEWVKLLKRDALDAERTNTNALAYLNRRHGWRQEDASDPTARVNITVNLPGALSRDDYLKVVSDERDI